MPIEEYSDFEDNIKNEVDDKRKNQLESLNLQIAIDNNFENLITQKCRYDHKFATYSDFGEITGEKIIIPKNNIGIIDIDINYEDIDNYFEARYADTLIDEIEDNLIAVVENNNSILVKTASDSYHIYCNGESVRKDPLLANKKSSYIKAFEYIKHFEFDDGTNADIKLFDVDIFIPTAFGANCGVMLPGSRVINKKGHYSCYTIIKNKDDVDEKMSSLYEIWDDIQEVYEMGSINSIWTNEKEVQSTYRTKKLNESEILKNGMSKEMFDLIIKGFEGVTIHNWAAPIEKEITLYPLICGLNACVNDVIKETDIEEAIDYIRENAKLTLNANLNFDRIMFSIDDISTTPFSLLKMLRFHNPDYYKKNLSPLIAKAYAVGDANEKRIITLDFLNIVINGFKDKYIYADFELTSDEITIGRLLGALYSCECDYITISNLKDLQLKLIANCNLTNAARMQLIDIGDNITVKYNSIYLIEMLKIHNPLFYSQYIESVFYLSKTGIDINDHFTIDRIKDKNYFTNGHVIWESLFSDISRGIVIIESDNCAYIKLRKAVNNSYYLKRISIDELKNRLSRITVKSADMDRKKNFKLDKLLFNESFLGITPYHENKFYKEGVCFYSQVLLFQKEMRVV